MGSKSMKKNDEKAKNKSKSSQIMHKIKKSSKKCTKSLRQKAFEHKLANIQVKPKDQSKIYRGKHFKTISYKVHSSKPMKSSFKKSSRRLKVKWSPEVKQIERPTSMKEDIKDPKKTSLFLKIHKDKTFVNNGVLHASYLSKKRPIIVLTLFDDKNKMIVKTNVNFKNKNILHIATNEYNIQKDGKTRIRTLFKLGDIIWCHSHKKVQRSKNCQGFDLSWLNKMSEFYADVMKKY
tara:strand:- start:14 stop:718 length:705 start_codon:yes stop_codon:yes gene_type:complete